MGTRRLAVVKNVSFEPLLMIHSPELPGPTAVHLLWQESQNIGDGPFLISAVLNGQMEGGLRLLACYQFQTMQRVNILDGTALKKRKEPSKIRNVEKLEISKNKINKYEILGKKRVIQKIIDPLL